MDANNSEPRFCKACGTPVPHRAPLGHCPRCLVDLGLDSAPNDPPAALSRLFGEYEQVEEIGRGGMGVVYRVWNVALKRLEALKLIGSNALAFPGLAQRLRLEAETAASLSHPHIVTIYKIGEHEGQPYFTMEFVEGASMAQFIGPDGFEMKRPAQEDRASSRERQQAIARLMSQIARAVDHAHKHGVLHRDLKPANVVIDRDGNPHLTDFGLAKVVGRKGSLSGSHAILGTPDFMSPEQAKGETHRVCTASDVYSLGAMLYAMLTGHPPLRADTPLATLNKVIHEAPKPPTTLNQAVDGKLAFICLHCLEKEPSRRYNSALALAEDLERWLRGEPIKARPASPAEMLWGWCRRQPALAAMAAGLVLLLAAVAVLGLTLYAKEKRERGKLERRIAVQQKALSDLIKPGTNETIIRISASKLAILAGREIEDTEMTVYVGLHMSRKQREQPDEIFHHLGPLLDRLQTSLVAAGHPMQLGLALYPDRRSLAEDLIKSEVGFMRIDPAEYVLALQQNTGATGLVEEVYSQGPSNRWAAIFVRESSGIGRLDELKNKSFAFGQVGSAGGDYLPKVELVTAGLRRGDFLRLTNLSLTAVPSAVIGGAFDAGVTDLDVLATFTNASIRLKVLKPLRVPDSLWVATKKVDPAVAQALKNGLLAQRERDVMAFFDHRLIGFRPFQPSDYDGLQQQIEKGKDFDQPR